MVRDKVIDSLIFGAALLFFVLVCMYILKRRIFDKGLRVLALLSFQRSSPMPAILAKAPPEVTGTTSAADSISTSLAILTSAAATWAKNLLSTFTVVSPPAPVILTEVAPSSPQIIECSREAMGNHETEALAQRNDVMTHAEL
jgi:hypothetical protein